MKIRFEIRSQRPLLSISRFVQVCLVRRHNYLIIKSFFFCFGLTSEVEFQEHSISTGTISNIWFSSSSLSVVINYIKSSTNFYWCETQTSNVVSHSLHSPRTQRIHITRRISHIYWAGFHVDVKRSECKKDFVRQTFYLRFANRRKTEREKPIKCFCFLWKALWSNCNGIHIKPHIIIIISH